MKIVVIHGDAHSLLSVRGPILSRLVEMGHQVHGLAPFAGEDVTEGIEALGVDFAAYPLTKRKFSPFADLGTLLHLKQVLYRIKPDVVLSISSKPMMFGPMAARMAWVDHDKRIYALVTGLGYPFTLKAGLKRRLLYAYTKYYLGGGFAACHGVLFRNEEDRSFFQKFGVLPDKVATTVIDEPLPENGVPVDPGTMADSNEAILSFMNLV